MSQASKTLSLIHEKVGDFFAEITVDHDVVNTHELNFNVALSTTNYDPIGLLSYNGRTVEDALQMALADLAVIEGRA